MEKKNNMVETNAKMLWFVETNLWEATRAIPKLEKTIDPI